MNMNKKQYILALIALFVMAIGFSSCEEEDEYTTDYNTGTPPAATVSLVSGSITDTGAEIVVSSNQDGIVWYVAVPAGSEATFEGYEFVLDDIDYYDGGDVEVKANANDTIDLTLFEGNTYSVYVVATNEAGQSGAVSSALSIAVTDESSPYVDSYSPGFQSAGLSIKTETVLTFNEPVTYVTGKVIELWGYNSGWSEIIAEENIIVSGNTVTLQHDTDYPYNDFIIHSVDAGAFVDASGNESAAISGFSYYYKTEVNPASLLENAFEEFLGVMHCTDYDYNDSTTLDYGPYAVTLTADEETEEPYDVIIEGYWGYGVTARMTFNEDGTVSCPANHIDGLTYGGEEVFWVRAYDGANPYNPGEVVGHWDWTDNSFNISVEIYGEYLGWFSRLWQEYVQPPATKNLEVGAKTESIPTPTPFE